MQDIWADFTEGCSEQSGPLLEHLSTVEVARDMDLMRQLVGDDLLYYFGSSYGTYIGATYAGLFPEKSVGSCSTAPSNPKEERQAERQIEQAAGFRRQPSTAYLEYCIEEGRLPTRRRRRVGQATADRPPRGDRRRSAAHVQATAR